ncbi:MAG: hypothetical protein ACI33K_06305 [Clostridiaceae bacterium]
MKKGDFLWALALLLWIVVLIVPSSREVFISITEAYPYIGGFFKFAVLATMGDLLGVRVLKGKWRIPSGVLWRALIWGIIGMMVTLVFTVFMGGAQAAQASGKLPFSGSVLAQAFFGSAIMNVTFGPMMMVFHRFTDLYIDMRYEDKNKKITLKNMIARIDWNGVVGFSWLKACPFFWIPAHTLVFLLSDQYRVIVSAFLSIALGLLLAVAKKDSHKEKTIQVREVME